MSHTKLPRMFGNEVLRAEVLVAAMSRPKVPPLAGDGAAPQTIVPVAAISRPKIPPLQGD